jgi:hypothetical protein
MKLTKQRLKQIIKEELETVVSENKRTIGDIEQEFMRIIKQVEGMTHQRSHEILARIRDAPVSQLASMLRMNLSHSERSQIDHELERLYNR